MSIFKEIKKLSRINPDKTAVVFEFKKLTYSELVQKVELVTNYLTNLKIKANDKVGLVSNNSIEFVLIFLAISNIGASVVPLSTSYTKKMIYQNFKKLKIKHLIIWYKYLNFFKNNDLKLKNIITIEKKIKGYDFFNEYENFKIKKKNKSINQNQKDFLIVLTSGSTSAPKPIVLTQKTKILRSIAMRRLYNIDKNDVVLTASPLDHSLGQRLLLLPLLSGGTSIILSTFTMFNFYEAMKKNMITFTILVSNQVSELIKDKKNFKDLHLKKGLVSASSKLTNQTKKILIKKKFNIYEMYGVSEIGTVTSICINKDRKNFKSVGKACSGADIKILSNNNEYLKKNKIGEIVCKTSLKFSKYFDLNKQTKEAFYKDYFKTGDIGYLDKNEYLYYLGRKKNVIKISGISVYPEDIETTVLQNKNISEAAVISFSDRNGAEKFVLCVVKKILKYDIENLRIYCQKNLTSFQQPSKIIFLKEIPRTTLGKINKPKLKKQISKQL